MLSGKIIDVWNGWRYRVQNNEVFIPSAARIEVALFDPHYIVRWEPDYETRPVRRTGAGLTIEWRDGMDYRGLCVDRGEIHAIWKPING